MKELGSSDRIGAAGCALTFLIAESDEEDLSSAAGVWQAETRSIAPISAIQPTPVRPLWPTRISGPRPKALRRVGPAGLENRLALPSSASGQAIELLRR